MRSTVNKPAFTPIIIINGVNDSSSICPSDGNSIMLTHLDFPQYCDDSCVYACHPGAFCCFRFAHLQTNKQKRCKSRRKQKTKRSWMSWKAPSGLKRWLCRSVSSHMPIIALNLTPDASNTPSLLSRPVFVVDSSWINYTDKNICRSPVEVSSVITSDPIYPTQSALTAPSSPSRPASFCPPWNSGTCQDLSFCPSAHLGLWRARLQAGLFRVGLPGTKKSAKNVYIILRLSCSHFNHFISLNIWKTKPHF